MKTINLEEILENAVKNELQHESDKDTILNAMREACNQSIDLCAENAKMIHKNNYGEAIAIECTIPFEAYSQSIIDRESILKLKKQIQ